MQNITHTDTLPNIRREYKMMRDRYKGYTT